MTRLGEVGWLIELRSDVPTWWSLTTEPEPSWTRDSNKALRFARKADAEAYMADIGWTDAFASEHIWYPDGRVNAPEPGSMDSHFYRLTDGTLARYPGRRTRREWEEEVGTPSYLRAADLPDD